MHQMYRGVPIKIIEEGDVNGDLRSILGVGVSNLKHLFNNIAQMMNSMKDCVPSRQDVIEDS